MNATDSGEWTPLSAPMPSRRQSASARALLVRLIGEKLDRIEEHVAENTGDEPERPES